MFPLLSVEFGISIAQTGGNVKRGDALSVTAFQAAPPLPGGFLPTGGGKVNRDCTFSLFHARFDRCLRRVSIANR